MHFEADSIYSLVTDFLVSNLVPICRNLNAEFIDVTNEKIGLSKRNLWPENWYTVGTGFKEPLTGGTPRISAHDSSFVDPIVILVTCFDTIPTIVWTIEIVTVTLNDKVRYQKWSELKIRTFQTKQTSDFQSNVSVCSSFPSPHSFLSFFRQRDSEREREREKKRRTCFFFSMKSFCFDSSFGRQVILLLLLTTSLSFFLMLFFSLSFFLILFSLTQTFTQTLFLLLRKIMRKQNQVSCLFLSSSFLPFSLSLFLSLFSFQPSRHVFVHVLALLFRSEKGMETCLQEMNGERFQRMFSFQKVWERRGKIS